MPYKEPIRKICVGCNKIFLSSTYNMIRCPGCTKKRLKIQHKIRQRRYRTIHRERVLESKKKYYRSGKKTPKVVCVRCGRLEHHYGRGMCVKCYRRWWRINRLSKKMTDEEKEKFFIKHGIIKEEKKDFTIEDLKSDLGVI